MKFKILGILSLSFYLYGSIELERDYNTPSSSASSTSKVTKPAQIRTIEEMLQEYPNATLDTKLQALKINVSKVHEDLSEKLKFSIYKLYESLAIDSKIIADRLFTQFEFNSRRSCFLLFSETMNIMSRIASYSHFFYQCTDSKDVLCMSSISIYPLIFNRAFWAPITRTSLVGQVLMRRQSVFLECYDSLLIKVPEIIEKFFKESAPTLYQSVEQFSKHESGCLAGTVLYFNGRSISIALGRKALTNRDDKSHHIERELIRKILPVATNIPGHLFVYTTLPPCNTPSTGCLSFYKKLVVENGRLNVSVMFGHEYEDGFNYSVSNTSNLTLVNLVKEKQQTKHRTKKIEATKKTAGHLERATSDQIVDALQNKPHDEAEAIIQEFKDAERAQRLEKKLYRQR